MTRNSHVRFNPVGPLVGWLVLALIVGFWAGVVDLAGWLA